MNQLTVMLNGNGTATNHQTSQSTAGAVTGATNQFFTFAAQSNGQQQQHHQQQQQHGTTTFTLDSNGHAQPTQQQQQLVTFQSQPQAGAMMLSNSYTTTPSTMMAQPQQQQPAGIQYILTNNQQPVPQQPTFLTTTTQPFGLMQNILTPGMGTMIPINQPLAGNTNGTIHVPTQTILQTANGTLQQGFVTMASNQHQQLFQTQQQQPQQQQQAQFQFQTAMNTNSAITINPSHQLIATGPTGPISSPFFLNQPMAAPAQTGTHQPIYQFVLSNGQVIQTMQPTTNQLIGPQIIQQTNIQQQTQQAQPQPNAITVPIQTGLGGQMNILAPNLALGPGPTTTFITHQQQQQQSTGGPTIQTQQQSQQTNHHQSTLITTHQSPVMQSTTTNLPNGLVIATPTVSHQSSIVLNASPQLNPQTNGQHQTLLIPAVSTAGPSQQQPQQSSTNTSAMVVLTSQSNGTNQSIGSALIPNTVLDHKTINNGQQQQSIVLLSPKMVSSSQQTFVNVGKITSIGSPKLTSKNSNGRQTPSSGNIKIVQLPKVKPTPIDQSTQCDDPQMMKLFETMVEMSEGNEQLTTQLSEPSSVKSDQDDQQTIVSQTERPSRPLSVSSCGSLKIAEDEEPQEESVEEEDIRQVDEHNHDALSTETEVDTHSVPTESETSPQSIQQPASVASKEDDEKEHETVSNDDSQMSAPIVLKNEDTKPTNKQPNSDKEGYQSSYGSHADSPCHFTDTEDEEEEEEIVDDGEREIKLVRKNGLTKAGYDMINNRLLGSDCGDDQATNDSKSSITSATVNGTDTIVPNNNGSNDNIAEEVEDDASNDSNCVYTMQMQTPSPSGSNTSGPMEPESTTNWIAKEKTIINIRGRFYNGIDLEPIREFAKRFKMFRLGYGLTQSQVCHDLAIRTDGQSYSQSAICRFEKLDITPKSAVKIKPVLESWMRISEDKYPKCKLVAEAMANEMSKEGSLFFQTMLTANEHGKLSEDESISSLNCIPLEPGKKRKKRTSFTPDQLDALNHYFEKNPKPSSEDMTEIAKVLSSCDPKINRDVVRVWFCNKRQALKAKRPNLMDPPVPMTAIAPAGDISRTNNGNRSTPLPFSVPIPSEAPKLLGLSTTHPISNTSIPFQFQTSIPHPPSSSTTTTINHGNQIRPINTIEGTSPLAKLNINNLINHPTLGKSFK